MNNISTFLAALADLMEKHEIDSIFVLGSKKIWIEGNVDPVPIGSEVTPESLFKLSKELENDS